MRKALFPTEEADGKDRAECGNSSHYTNRQQDVSHVDTQKCIFHHRKPLRQREEADELLHHGRHDLDGQRRAGKDQHGKIEDRGNDAGLLGILRHAARQHADGKGGEHGERPTPEERRKRTAQPHAPQMYFDFKREVMANAQDNAQIELTDAQKRQIEINTILNLSGVLDSEKILELVAEQLDLDYDELKAHLAKQEIDNAQALFKAPPDAPGGEGDVIA